MVIPNNDEHIVRCPRTILAASGRQFKVSWPDAYAVSANRQAPPQPRCKRTAMSGWAHARLILGDVVLHDPRTNTPSSNPGSIRPALRR